MAKPQTQATELEKLRTILADAEKDAVKFFTKGNYAAGTRLRNNLQSIKAEATDIRKKVVETRNKQA